MQQGSAVEFAELLGARLVAVVGQRLVGMCLHGSAALGGFRSGASDVDVLVVVDQHLPETTRHDIAQEIQAADVANPGRGTEVSVILSEVALAGGRRLDYQLHVTTDPSASKVIDGIGQPGDPDLILHMAVCRQSGISVFGPEPETVFAEISQRRIIIQMIEELTWAREQASEAYAVLNTCRAHFYLDRRTLCSKLEGGGWGLGQLDSTELIERSLAVQQGRLEDRLPSLECRRFIDTALVALTNELNRIPND